MGNIIPIIKHISPLKKKFTFKIDSDEISDFKF